MFKPLHLMKLADVRLWDDPGWNEGDYDEGEGPDNGLAVARMMAHITYLSDHGMEEKFGGSKRLDYSNGI